MPTTPLPKPLRFESNLLDGGSVSSSMELHEFDYIDGDCICRYIDSDGDKKVARRSEGYMYDLATGDWIDWNLE